MKLSKGVLPQLHERDDLQLPTERCMNLPEKVLQFGTGVLLRGLPDFFIDKANKQGIFNGRVVVVKSTDKGDTTEFDQQDNLYTQCVRGMEGGKKVEANIVNASISRVLTAATQWDQILECATSEDMQVVISNTTELGIVYIPETIFGKTPSSFPGKLLAWLYKRFQYFNGHPDKGMVIVPAELIPENGTLLKGILHELALHNQLSAEFIHWLQNHNHCCNSLVDSIIPGAATIDMGYEDELLIMTEAYRLWAIETSNDKVKATLSFAMADSGVILAPDINVFRELKLRLLNGAHTLSCGLAYLSGIATVKEAMSHEDMSAYIEGLLLHEIIPAITDSTIRQDAAVRFAAAVQDRFRNPYIDHRWLNICSNYTSKLKTRVMPILLQYEQRMQQVPALIALGFAAHLLFMKNPNGDTIDDTWATAYAALWQEHSVEEVVKLSLSNTQIWGRDLSALPGFGRTVSIMLKALLKEGVSPYLEKVAAEIIIS
ncbi:tagaturonate reductase [Chitinophaga dinghuensis]|uniref:Tagaturonate reductase n=1 Tax=Chitinophaga dinghuensis TaxID=1539050 RepID=A0A327VR07_9BACT|nr:tagaturonate reductase [Chitinophaga dinghuensis]RAJ77473.1 tagaturonate reductase [Chitinophaga dinghuensis]